MSSFAGPVEARLVKEMKQISSVCSKDARNMDRTNGQDTGVASPVDILYTCSLGTKSRYKKNTCLTQATNVIMVPTRIRFLINHCSLLGNVKYILLECPITTELVQENGYDFNACNNVKDFLYDIDVINPIVKLFIVLWVS